MKGVHEDIDGRFFYATYHVGDIIRRGDDWGVVVSPSGRYGTYATVDWLIDGEWLPVRSDMLNCSAPWSLKNEGIPDEVRARAAMVVLTS